MGIVSEFGIQLDTSDAIIRRIIDSQRADERLGEGWVGAASSVNTALAASFANEVRVIQEDLARVFNSISPSRAQGAALFELGERLGLFRRDATFSTVTLTLNLDDNTTVPAGARVRVPGAPQMVYQTLQQVSNTTGDTADFQVVARAVTVGPDIFASANTLTEIVDEETGWNSANNAADTSQGTRPETELEFRLRIDQSAAIAGRGTIDSIRAAVRNVPGVSNVRIFNNRTGSTLNGVPPWGFETLLQGGDDDAIAQAIWNSNAASTQTFGNIFGTATDTEGDTHVVRFSRPVEVPIQVELNVDQNVDFNEAGFKSEFVQRANQAFLPGANVTLARLACIALDIVGVDDILSLTFSKVGDSLGVAPVDIADRELAFFDTLEVTVL